MARTPALATPRSKRRGKARVSSPPRSASDRRGLDRRWYIGIAVAALLVVAGLVAASVLSARGSASPSGRSGGAAAGTVLPGAREVNRLLRGIPQNGATLGDPNAPVTLVEYADPQCPYCAAFAAQTFPELVRRYVRPGDVKIELRGIAIIGPQSVGGLEAVYAAGEQAKLWNMLEVTYANQGGENTGWLDDDFVRAAARSIPGVDVDRLLAARSSDTVGRQLEEAASQARAAGVTGTPTFQVGRTGEALGAPFNVRVDGVDDLAKRVDPLLGR